ncbi:hypothetical protein DPMN_074008 [Dreissena polymorpha]|uniref:Uncharacterized protein n=1 Tax=Dreissena polymorpha TaxID=45954 RepID=A0A9D4BL87_DREPO|nr:hypothetical protein DPMN_074008 [Dreissena polymorpha]
MSNISVTLRKISSKGWLLLGSRKSAWRLFRFVLEMIWMWWPLPPFVVPRDRRTRDTWGIG